MEISKTKVYFCTFLVQLEFADGRTCKKEQVPFSTATAREYDCKFSSPSGDPIESSWLLCCGCDGGGSGVVVVTARRISQLWCRCSGCEWLRGF